MNPFFLSQDFLSNLFTKVAAKLVTSLTRIQEGKFPHGSLIRFPHLLLQECSKNYIRLVSLIQSGSPNIVLITNIGSIQNKWLLHVFHSLMYVTLTISPFKGRVGISVQFLFSLFLVCSSKKCWRGSWQLFSRQLSRRRHGQLDFVWRWVWSVIIPNAVKSCILCDDPIAGSKFINSICVKNLSVKIFFTTNIIVYKKDLSVIFVRWLLPHFVFVLLQNQSTLNLILSWSSFSKYFPKTSPNLSSSQEAT